MLISACVCVLPVAGRAGTTLQLDELSPLGLVSCGPVCRLRRRHRVKEVENANFNFDGQINNAASMKKSKLYTPQYR